AVQLEWFAWWSELECLNELVFGDNVVRLFCLPRVVKVLKVLALEDESLRSASCSTEGVEIDESFDVKLPQHESLPLAIVADDTKMMVHLACFVLLLWRICGRVVLLNELVAKDELISALNRPRACFAFGRAFPVAKEEANRLPSVCLVFCGIDTGGGDNEKECNDARFHRPNEKKLSRGERERT